jgi:hypothetical protein
MKSDIIIFVVVCIALVLFYQENNNPQYKDRINTFSTTSECNNAQVTGQKYNVIGSEINVRKGPGIGYEKIINQKATNILKTTHYISIDESTVIFEECTKGKWSWIRVLQPEWLKSSHQGWVLTKFIDKGQYIGDDPYARKISSSALDPYDAKNYPKTIELFGSRLKEIEALRRRSAEIAVDSGKCDFATFAELSHRKSTLNHLHFWVDCRNGQRIRFDEFLIKENGIVVTQEEKAWSEKRALSACQEAIKSSSLIPDDIDIHTIIGTSIYKAPVTHNVVVTMDFDVNNAFNVQIPYTAKCYFQPGEVAEIEINKRRK